jgi:hypothetical protein
MHFARDAEVAAIIESRSPYLPRPNPRPLEEEALQPTLIPSPGGFTAGVGDGNADCIELISDRVGIPPTLLVASYFSLLNQIVDCVIAQAILFLWRSFERETKHTRQLMHEVSGL